MKAVRQEPSDESDEYIPISLHWSIPGLVESAENTRYVNVVLSKGVDLAYLEMKLDLHGNLIDFVLVSVWVFERKSGSVIPSRSLPGNPKLLPENNSSSVDQVIPGDFVVLDDGVQMLFSKHQSSVTIDAGGIYFGFDAEAGLCSVSVPMSDERIGNIVAQGFNAVSLSCLAWLFVGLPGT